MKIVLISVAVLVLTLVARLFYLGHESRKGKAPGKAESMLKQCSPKPNCVCSEYLDAKIHLIRPIEFKDKPVAEILAIIEKSIENTGGLVTSTESDYLSATYSSGVFGFMDDFEIRIDNDAGKIHIRSASRVGNSDLGANRKRVKLFKQEFLRLSE